MKYHHMGVPTEEPLDNGTLIPHLNITVTEHTDNIYGIQLMNFHEDADYPDLVKTKPHLAFEVDDLEEAMDGKKVIIPPNSPSEGLTVAFIEVSGMPVELMCFHDRGNHG